MTYLDVLLANIQNVLNNTKKEYVAMARRKKKKSLFERALNGTWEQSAVMATFILGAAFFVPLFLSSAIYQPLISNLIPFALLLAIFFGLVSAFKFYSQKSPEMLNIFSFANQTSDALKSDAVTIVQKSNKAQPIEPAKQERPSAWSLKLIQDIEWKKFEELSTAYYLEKGMRAEVTSLGADGGINIKLYQSGSDDPVSIVQCKSWKVKQVGVKEIREFLGVMTHEKVAKGFFMTSGKYSDEAKKTARENKIILINGGMMLAMIKRLPIESQQKLLSLSTEGDYLIPTCSACGVKMIWHTKKHSGFWGCRHYPKCRQRLFAKSV